MYQERELNQMTIVEMYQKQAELIESDSITNYCLKRTGHLAGEEAFQTLFYLGYLCGAEEEDEQERNLDYICQTDMEVLSVQAEEMINTSLVRIILEQLTDLDERQKRTVLFAAGLLQPSFRLEITDSKPNIQA